MPDAQILGPYRLERVLGTGSFATVWLAHDDVLDRRVAVKILADNWSQDNEVRRRFLSEARLLLTAESPRIVRGFHLGETPSGQPYLVMAWADRGTLDDRIEQRRREGRSFEIAEVVGIAGEIAAALVDVHQAGHLHRDVKPTNVLIRSSSTLRHIAGLAPDETVVLADFGLARGLDMTSLTLVAGSPGYVAPEQAAGLTQLDRRADLYSLGRVVLELLTGDPGGRATTMAGAASERIDVPAQLAGMATPPPARLTELVTRLVATSPDDRPSTADEVAAELGAIRRELGPGVAGPPVRPLAPPTALLVDGGDQPLTGTQLAAPPPKPTGGWRALPRWAVAVAAAAIVGIGVVLVALTSGGGGGSGEGTTTTSFAGGSTTAPAVVASDPPPDSTTAGGNVLVPPILTIAPTDTADGTETTSVVSATSSEVSSVAPIGSSEPVATTEPESTGPESTGPETTGPETTGPETTGPVAVSVPEDERLALPGVFHDLAQSTASQDVGLWEGPAESFADFLLDANPDWELVPAVADSSAVSIVSIVSSESSVPSASVEFELAGPVWSATVTAAPAALTTERDITRFTITYH